MEELLQVLRKFDAIRDNETHKQHDKIITKIVARHEPVYSSDEIWEKISEPISKAIHNIGISRLYQHQADAILQALNNDDIVLESPTASGKTLSFLVPMIECLLNNPKSHVLLIHPMKALSNDQRRQITIVSNEASRIVGRPLETWIYDGDTPNEHRKLLRQNPPHVLFTNPEMLHQSFLGWSEQWFHFLKNLKLIILDEIHEYRGYFGTNISLLLRRFLAKVNKIGSNPQLILASATCSNPEEHAHRLTGRNFRLIKSHTQMRPERQFIFVNPDIQDYHFHQIYMIRIVRAALACLNEGLSVLIFCPSRKFAEDAARRCRLEANSFNLDENCISPYRSGYESEDRRKIEDGLREGIFKVVFTTNALEIGIDIGRLDVCILAGFPDNVMSAWQRIGRIGRSWKANAYILFFAMNTSMDQFFVNNIDSFLTKPLDEILIGTDNEELIDKHMRYLLYEQNYEIKDDLKEIIGDAFYQRAKDINTKIKGPKLKRGPNYQQLNIRGDSGESFKLIYNGKEIGSISGVHLFREAYIGAVYNHLGKPYRVAKHGYEEIELQDVESPFWRTDPKFYTVINVTETLNGNLYNEKIATYYGCVTIFENFAGYRLIDERNGEVLLEQTEHKARTRDVRAYWLEIVNPDFLDDINIVDQGIRVAEQFMRIGAPFLVPCDLHDFATFSETKNKTIAYFYETLPGGIGIAEKMLSLWERVIRQGIKIAEGCECKSGCARCIYPAMYKASDAGELNKNVGKAFADKLLQEYSSSTEIMKFNYEIHAWE